MKTLSFEQMEKIKGGKEEMMDCGRAIMWGGMIGGMFGGAGALIGMALVALGPNCLDL